MKSLLSIDSSLLKSPSGSYNWLWILPAKYDSHCLLPAYIWTRACRTGACKDRQTDASSGPGTGLGFTWGACLSYVLPRGLPVWSFLRKIVMHGICGLSTAARRCPVCCDRSVWECWSQANGGCAQTLRGHCPFAVCSSMVLGFKGSERKLWREDE